MNVKVWDILNHKQAVGSHSQCADAGEMGSNEDFSDFDKSQIIKVRWQALSISKTVVRTNPHERWTMNQ